MNSLRITEENNPANNTRWITFSVTTDRGRDLHHRHEIPMEALDIPPMELLMDMSLRALTQTAANAGEMIL